MNPGLAVIFLQLKFHLHKPLYLRSRLEELAKYRKHAHKVLLLHSDCADEMNYFHEVQMECLRYDCVVIVVWSSAEAAQYLRTMKAYENRGKKQLAGLSQATTVREQAVEVLASIRTV